MDNKEDILDALNEFEKKPCSEKSEIPLLLEQYLQQVAKTGKTLFPWHKLKKLFVTKVDLVMTQFKETSPTDMLQTAPNVEPVKYEDMRKRIMYLMEEFQGAPFTVQRLCELLLEPKRHYKRCDKFLRGIEKNVSVVTTVDPFGRKISSESQAMVNGLDSNGFNEMIPKQNPFSSIPIPTQAAWSASVDKWFGTNNSGTESSKQDTNQQSSDQCSNQDENLTEQELVDPTEMEPSDTSRTDGDAVTCTAINSMPDQKEEPEPDSSEAEITSQKEEPQMCKEASPETRLTESEEVNEEKNLNVSEKMENSSQSEDTRQDSCSNIEDTLQSGHIDSVKDDTEKSSQALDICNNAQSIIDSVNKACSEADETVSIAQKVCDSDQEEQSLENSDDESNVENSANQVEQAVESTTEQSTLNIEKSKDTDTAEQISDVQSGCDKTDLVHKMPICDEDIDSSSEAKKPKLQLPDNGESESESMDVDSTESSEINSALNTNSASSAPSESEKESENVTQVESSEDTPMEQD